MKIKGVKPLVWEDVGEGYFYARTMLGVYSAGPDGWCSPAVLFEDAKSLEAAKSAAEAHWQARVMEALDVEP